MRCDKLISIKIQTFCGYCQQMFNWSISVWKEVHSFLSLTTGVIFKWRNINKQHHHFLEVWKMPFLATLSQGNIKLGSRLQVLGQVYYGRFLKERKRQQDKYEYSIASISAFCSAYGPWNLAVWPIIMLPHK